VIPTNSSLAPEAVPTCSATASVTYDQGVVAGQTYTFTLQAYAGAALFLQSSCFVPSTYAGVTATAQCDPLVPLLPDAGITDAGSD
jgi:hypothetical protein